MKVQKLSNQITQRGNKMERLTKSLYKKFVNFLKVNANEIFFRLKVWNLKIAERNVKNIDDKDYIEKQYYKKTGQKLNLENPITYNEKIQWLKLNYRNPLMKKCVDKYEVREYVLEKVGKPEILIPLIGIYNNIDEVDFDKLPNQFIMKLTNGSSFNYICKNKTEKEIKKIKARFREWIKLDYYALGREWAYKDVKNRIICEELLKPSNGQSLDDYRFFCFNGKVKFIAVDTDSVVNGIKTSNYYRNIYTPEWEKIDATIEYPNVPNGEIPKPKRLDEMIEMAEKLSEGFPTVRVDFYYFDEKIYFGELTFYHAAGYQKFHPPSFAKQAGKYITII